MKTKINAAIGYTVFFGGVGLLTVALLLLSACSSTPT